MDKQTYDGTRRILQHWELQPEEESLAILLQRYSILQVYPILDSEIFQSTVIDSAKLWKRVPEISS